MSYDRPKKVKDASQDAEAIFIIKRKAPVTREKEIWSRKSIITKLWYS
jgi:hypothetical protein